MWLVRLALRRPFTVAAFCLVVLLLGVLSAGTMQTDIFPSIDIPVVVVVWNYPGLSAEDMESRVTFISERSISTSVSGVQRIDSQTVDSTSVLRVYFEQDADIGGAIAQITAASLSASRVMPPGITPPVVLRFNASNVPVAQMTLSGTATEQQLFDWGLNFLRVRLFTIPGLSTPAPFGGKQREIMVSVQPERAAAKGVSPQDIVTALLSQNVILPAGTARFGNTNYDVLINGSPPTADDFNRLPIREVGGATVFLGDVASTHDGYAPQVNVVRVDGRRAAYLAILKKENSSTLAVVDSVRDMLPTLQAIAPRGVVVKLAFDQSRFVRGAVTGVVREAAIAAGLVALMVLAFVGSWRSTFIVALSIPLAVLIGVCGLKLAGQTFNLMTLGGLSLVIGMLVDDATVEVENINRNRAGGAPILQAISRPPARWPCPPWPPRCPSASCSFRWSCSPGRLASSSCPSPSPWSARCSPRTCCRAPSSPRSRPCSWARRSPRRRASGGGSSGCVTSTPRSWPRRWPVGAPFSWVPRCSWGSASASTPRSASTSFRRSTPG